MATEVTRPAEAPANLVQARVLARPPALYRLSGGRFLWTTTSKRGGARCASRPSGGSPGRNAASSSATSRTARTSSCSP